MPNITIQSEGRRHYILGTPYAAKGRIRAAGCRWDADRKAWWTGKRDVAEQLVASLGAGASDAPSQPSSERPSREAPGTSATVAARATYRGRTYYVAGRVDRGRTHWDDRVDGVVSRDGSRVLLYFRDGSSSFWAPRSEVQIVKSYQRPTTIARLQEYAQQAKAGVSYADYQAAIEAAEDQDYFQEARRLESIGYAGWRAEQGGAS